MVLRDHSGSMTSANLGSVLSGSKTEWTGADVPSRPPSAAARGPSPSPSAPSSLSQNACPSLSIDLRFSELYTVVKTQHGGLFNLLAAYVPPLRPDQSSTSHLTNCNSGLLAIGGLIKPLILPPPPRSAPPLYQLP